MREEWLPTCKNRMHRLSHSCWLFDPIKYCIKNGTGSMDELNSVRPHECGRKETIDQRTRTFHSQNGTKFAWLLHITRTHTLLRQPITTAAASASWSSQTKMDFFCFAACRLEKKKNAFYVPQLMYTNSWHVTWISSDPAMHRINSSLSTGSHVYYM